MPSWAEPHVVLVFGATVELWCNQLHQLPPSSWPGRSCWAFLLLASLPPGLCPRPLVLSQRYSGGLLPGSQHWVAWLWLTHSLLQMLYFSNLKLELVEEGHFPNLSWKSLFSIKIRSYLVIFSKTFLWRKSTHEMKLSQHIWFLWSPELMADSYGSPRDPGRPSWDSLQPRWPYSNLPGWHLFPLWQILPWELCVQSLDHFTTCDIISSSFQPPHSLLAKEYRILLLGFEHTLSIQWALKTELRLLFFSGSCIFSKANWKQKHFISL
jgi:hypothetical protein